MMKLFSFKGFSNDICFWIGVGKTKNIYLFTSPSRLMKYRINDQINIIEANSQEGYESQNVKNFKVLRMVDQATNDLVIFQ